MAQLNGDQQTPVAAVGERIAGRYRVEALLGRGGMGVVYLSEDEATGQRVALKRMDVDPKRAAKLSTFFMREYHTLRQLAHPCIIEAYDYGIDELGPYYTMELLSGRDLAELAPLPWRAVCAVLRDVASALSLIHSRQLVHRDVSPRNVRYTQSGKTKLIDFGALASIGVCSELIGTPAFIPPEAANGQALDARADLYSLGAIGYWLLTSRHAYPAKSVRSLRDAWRSRPAPINLLARDVPRALENLILSLLSLDPLARPVSANEVIERLTAIGGLETAAALADARPYLTTPTLVGRHEELLRLRKHLLSATRGRGGAVIIEAPGGMGRTRMLQAVELEGRLAGATVLQLSAVECASQTFGIAHGLVARMLEFQPELALAEGKLDCAVLGHISAELHAELGGGELATPALPRELPGMVQRAVCDWLLRVCRKHCLVIDVDDAEQADERSLALLAMIAHEGQTNRLALIVAVETGVRAVAQEALSALRRTSSTLALAPLDASQTEALARSVFGDVPNLKAVADWIRQLSEGAPRGCLELMQHMLDQGIIRYERGSFLLPESLREHKLPHDLSEAMHDVISRLPSEARELARALALSEVPLRLEEYPLALGLEAADAARALAAVDVLVEARVLVINRVGYRFRHHPYAEAARKNMTWQEERTTHLRLARIYELRDDLRRHAEHLLNAGEELRALATLLRHLERTNPGIGLFGAPPRALPQALDPRYLVEDTSASVEIRRRLLEVCERFARPPRERFMIRGGLLFLANQYDMSLMRGYVEEHVEDLRKYTGAIDWDETDPAGSPLDRAQACLARAQRNFEATSEDQRVLAPQDAAGAMLVNLGMAQAYGRQSFDLPLLERLVAFGSQFSELSVAHRMSYQAGLHVREFVAGRSERAARVRAELLSEYDGFLSARVPLQPSALIGMFILTQWEGIYRALQAGEQGLPWVQKMEDAARWPWLGPNRANPVNLMSHTADRRVWELRRLCHLFNGNAEGARACLEQIERVMMQHTYSAYGGGMAFFEAQAHALSGDLLGLKQSVETIAKIVEQQYPGWKPFLQVATGDYHRLRGELDLAIAAYDNAIGATGAGQHAAWTPAVAGRIGALIEKECYDAALGAARDALEACVRAELGMGAERELGRVLALAEAHSGSAANAAARLDQLIAEAHGCALGGLPLGVLFESRARVALLRESHADFERYAQLTGAQYRAGRNPALMAKYERLIEAARARQSVPAATLEQIALLDSVDIVTDSSNEGTQLEATRDDEHRPRRALGTLVRELNAKGGLLYAVRGEDLELVAAISQQTSREVESALAAYLQAEIESSAEVTVSAAEPVSGSSHSQDAALGNLQPFLIRSVHESNATIVGIAALVAPDGQRTLNLDTLSAIAGSLIAGEDAVSVYVPR